MGGDQAFGMGLALDAIRAKEAVGDHLRGLFFFIPALRLQLEGDRVR